MKRELRRLLDSTIRMGDLLRKAYGIEAQRGKPFSCPFPDHGSSDVRPSAQLFEDSNVVYCYAEQRRYTVYDALKALGKSDVELEAFVMRGMGGLEPMELKGSRDVAVYEALVGSQLEGAAARFRRGELPWSDVLPVVTGYLDRTLEGD